jgi:mannosyltransferase
MGESFNVVISTVFLAHRKLIFITLASLSLFGLFWAPQTQTSALWLKSTVYKSTDKAPPYTAAIVYLVSITRVPELLESLASIKANLPDHPWPVILFHNGELDHDSSRMDLIGRIQDYIGIENRSIAFSERLEFVSLDWRLPEGISADKEVVDPVDSYRWPGKWCPLCPFKYWDAEDCKDYHHMSSFFATQIFSHQRLKDVTYFMRMDTDSLFTEPLCYDPFEFMHIRRRSYGYLSTGSDSQEYTEGMWPFVHNFVDTRISVQEQLRVNNWEWPHSGEKGEDTLQFKGYNTNFEIVELDAFRRPEVKEWLSALEKYPEGIFKWRWGKSTSPITT